MSDPIVAPRTGVVTWKTIKFRGQEVQLLGDGRSLMLALEKHPRIEVGQQFVAAANEVTWDAA